MMTAIAAMIIGLIAILLAPKLKAFNEKNMQKLEERKKQKEAEKNQKH
jgi:hypothetical protein